MAKFITFKKGILLGLTAATLAINTPFAGAESESGKMIKKGATTAARYGAGTYLGEKVGSTIGQRIGGIVKGSPLGAGLGAFFTPSRTATDEEMRKLTEEYRKKQQQQRSSSSGSYRSCSGCAAK